MHLEAGFLAGFGQRFDEVLPIDVVHKNILPAISVAHYSDKWHPDMGPEFCAASAKLNSVR